MNEKKEHHSGSQARQRHAVKSAGIVKHQYTALGLETPLSRHTRSNTRQHKGNNKMRKTLNRRLPRGRPRNPTV